MTFEQEKDKPIMGKILIVEDTPIAAKVADIFLTEQHCTTVWVTSGEEALLKLSPDFHFILMDLGLPGIDGFETTKQIRLGHPDIANIPIIALTAHQDGAAIKAAKDAGMNGFFSKPFSRAQSIRLVDTFIRTKVSQCFLT